MKYAWIEGEYLPEEDAKISIFDRGVVIGDGVFETVLAENGIPEFFHQHFDRFEIACKKLKLLVPLDEREFREIILTLCAKNNLNQAAVRITYTRGIGLPGLDIEPKQKGNLFITAKEVSPALRNDHSKGVAIQISQYTSHQANALDPCIKSTNYLVNIMAKHEAVVSGFDDALFLNEKKEVAEFTTASLFAVIEGKLHTPPLAAAILPGITRSVFIQNAQLLGMELVEEPLSLNNLYQADEIFMTSSLRGSKSVDKIEKVNFKIEGKWTKALRAAYFKSAKVDRDRHLY